jgi:hypothetical protein
LAFQATTFHRDLSVRRHYKMRVTVKLKLGLAFATVIVLSGMTA